MNKDVYDFREDIGVRKVSLEKVLRHALQKWKLILLAGVLLGGFFGCYKILNDHRQKGQIQAAYEAFEARMEAYTNQQADLRAQIASLQKKIAQRQTYLNESVKMQLDPMACPQAFAEIQINVPEVDPDDTGEDRAAIYKLTSIMKAYYDEILYGVSTKKLASKYGLREDYFTELIAPMYDYYSSSLRIQVRYTDEETAMKIMDDLLEILDEKTQYYKTVFGDYDYEIYVKDTTIVTDTDLSTYQVNKSYEISQLQNYVNNAVNSLSSLSIPTPVKQYSKRQLLKDGIKLGIVGFAGGCALMLLLLMSHAVALGKIFTPDEIDGAYGLRNLASFAYGRKKNFPEEIDFVLAQLENVLRDKEEASLAVVGTVGEKKLAAMRKVLNERQNVEGKGGPRFVFTDVPDVSGNAGSLRSLPSYDGYVLVEEIGKSKYKAVQNELRLLFETGKEVVGTIYL